MNEIEKRIFEKKQRTIFSNILDHAECMEKRTGMRAVIIMSHDVERALTFGQRTEFSTCGELRNLGGYEVKITNGTWELFVGYSLLAEMGE